MLRREEGPPSVTLGPSPPGNDLTQQTGHSGCDARYAWDAQQQGADRTSCAPTIVAVPGRMVCLPGILDWMLSVIQNGFSLQFRCRPPHIKGVIASTVQAQEESVLLQEICSLLTKQAIEAVPMQERERERDDFTTGIFCHPEKRQRC